MVVEEEIKNADLLTEGIMDVIKRAYDKVANWFEGLE